MTSSPPAALHEPYVLKRSTPLVLAAAAAVAVLIPWVVPEYITVLIIRALILAIVAVSLDVLIGYSGIGALGHAAFFAIGGYTTAILLLRMNASFPLTLISAILLAAAVSAATAPLVLRATGLFALLISLAIAMCVWGLIYRWVSLTGGEDGLSGMARPHLAGLPDLTVTTNFYYFILVIFLICLASMLLFIKSPFGKTLMGIRDAEGRMMVLGYNVWLHKYMAMVITGAFAGLAGNLHSYFNSFINPEMCSLGTCMDFVLMVIIGGPGTMVGACIGAFILVLLKEMMSIYTSRWLMVLGIAYIITALYAPNGILRISRKGKRRANGVLVPSPKGEK